MSIRLPLQGVLSYSNQNVQGGGPASIAGGVAKQFFIPQDTDNIVVKLTASVAGGGVSATLQTTDDGGVTWWDVARTSIVSNAVASNAEWLSVPTIGAGMATGINYQAGGSVLTVATGNAGAASTLSQRQVSGLPIMSPNARIFLRYTSAITSILSEAVTVSVNNQSGTA